MVKGRSPSEREGRPSLFTVKLIAIAMSQGLPFLVGNSVLATTLKEMGIHPHISSLFFFLLTLVGMLSPILWNKRSKKQSGEQRYLITGFTAFIVGQIFLLIATYFAVENPLLLGVLLVGYALTVPSGGAFVVLSANHIIKMEEKDTSKVGFVTFLKMSLGGLMNFLGLQGPPVLMIVFCITGALLLFVLGFMSPYSRIDYTESESKDVVTKEKLTFVGEIRNLPSKIRKLFKVPEFQIGLAGTGFYAAFQASQLVLPYAIEETLVGGTVILIAAVSAGFFQLLATNQIKKKKDFSFWHLLFWSRILGLLAIAALVIVEWASIVSILFIIILFVGRFSRGLTDTHTHQISQDKRKGGAYDLAAYNASLLVGSLISGLPLEWVFLLLLLLSLVSLGLTLLFRHQHRIL